MAVSVWRGSRPFVRWPLGGHMCDVRKWPFMFYGTQVWQVLSQGAACMGLYGKLSRVFAVQLLSTFIGHYAALPPVRSDPHWSHSHAITASIRLALTHALQHRLLATQTPAVVTTTCLDGLTDIPLRLLPTDIGCGTLAPRSRQDTATHRCSRPKPRQAVATTTCLDYLHSHTRTMRPSTATASPTYVQPTPNGH
jgi:hypothetical protein